MTAHCKHYSPGMLGVGPNKAMCRALVKPIMQFCGGNSFGWTKKAPCFGRPVEAVCAKAEFPTADEISAMDAAFDAAVAMVVKVRPAIVAEARRTGELVGAMDCPKCESAMALQWSMARSNGHIHAHCKTPDCVAWME